VGCAIVRRAAELVAAETPEVKVCLPEQCVPDPKAFVVAVDSSSHCRAYAPLREVGVRPALIVSAPEVMARGGLLKPGMDVRADLEELARALAQAIRESLAWVLEQVRERRRYREEMGPVMARFRGLWEKVEALPAPNGVPEAAARERVELLGRRARNVFTKFDEILPPAEWAEEHDLFQDALLCIAYATEGWGHGDAARWEQNLEKARAQMTPLLRRLRQ
jgi:hypothetical protein